MSVFNNIKMRFVRRHYTKNNFLTIDPDKFLQNMYKEILGQSGKQKFIITEYGSDLLVIANEMLKFSYFEQVSEEDGKCYMNNDLIFFELTNKFWEQYNKAMDFYEREEFLAMCGWYDSNITKEEREICHNTMVELLCERMAIQESLHMSQQEKRLLTADEKCMILSEHEKMFNLNTRS